MKQKKFAERMGYRWQEKSHEDLGYDLFIFKREITCIVRVGGPPFPFPKKDRLSS